LADIAFQRLLTTWKTKHRIKLATKLRLYNASVRPILLYNTSCLGTIANQESCKLSTTHRKHPHYLCSIHHTSRTTNKHLMQRTRSKPLTIDIATVILSLFGHILRQPRTPAYRIMEHYFKSDQPFKSNNVSAYPLHESHYRPSTSHRPQQSGQELRKLHLPTLHPNHITRQNEMEKPGDAHHLSRRQRHQ
jgi:hypothetical protein